MAFQNKLLQLSNTFILPEVICNIFFSKAAQLNITLVHNSTISI